MNNIMLDLDTMGKGPRAAIVSIGAVFFDPMTGELGAEFESYVDLNDSANFGEIAPDTVLWWLGQSDEARAAISHGDGLKTALINFCEWIQDYGSDNGSGMRVWGNGASFDNVILRSAFTATSLPLPWEYRNDRDVRTVVELGLTLLGFDPKKEIPYEGGAQRTLDYAKHQARYVSAIYQKLEEGIA